MTGFFGWFLVIVGVLAIFNAEKLPALRQMMEEKFKDSVDAAKKGAELAKDKVEKAKAEIEAKKNAPEAVAEPEENTPEETEEALQFMGNFIKKEEDKTAPVAEVKTEETPVVEEAPAEEAQEDEEKPVDLNHRN